MCIGINTPAHCSHSCYCFCWLHLSCHVSHTNIATPSKHQWQWQLPCEFTSVSTSCSHPTNPSLHLWNLSLPSFHPHSNLSHPPSSLKTLHSLQHFPSWSFKPVPLSILQILPSLHQTHLFCNRLDKQKPSISLHSAILNTVE